MDAKNPSRPSVIQQLDLVILFSAIVVDVRLFQGSGVPSFTVYELVAWTYCAPYVLSRVFLERYRFCSFQSVFLYRLGLYILWLFLVSAFGVLFRDSTDVLQDAKNVTPAVILVAFVFLRIQRIESVIFICNLYIACSILSSFLGVVQYLHGGPYFRDLLEGTEYKVDVDGNLIVNPVVGLSRHPNEFAMVILPGFILCVFYLRSQVHNVSKLKLVTVVGTLILGTGLILSQAKGATLFCVLSIIYFISPLGRMRSVILKVGWTAGLVLFLVAYGLYLAGFGGVAGSGTIETRYLLWLTSLNALISDSYVGWFGDGAKFVAKWSIQTSGWEFPDAHNAWIDQALYFGIPAVILYLSIWTCFFRLAARALVASMPGTEQALLLGIQAVVLAFMGDYFFEPVAIAVLPLSQLFLFMSLGIQIAALRAQNIVASDKILRRLLPPSRETIVKQTASVRP